MCMCHSACVWPTALELGSIANFDMLFRVIGFISLVDEIQFMLISSRLSGPIYFPRSQTPRVQTWRFIALRVKTYCGKRFAL